MNHVGRSLKRLVSSDAAYRILDRHPGIAGGTWNQGGCWVLAEALRRVLGDDAELWAVMTARGPSRGFVQHVVVKWHGKFYDADGESTERALLLRWRDEELLAEPYLEPFEESRTTEETVCPVDAVRDVMEMVAGKLVPNTERESFSEQIARMRREREAHIERVREEVERTGAYIVQVTDANLVTDYPGGWQTITRSTRPGVTWQVTYWQGDPRGPNAIPTGHIDITGSLTDAAKEVRPRVR